MFLDQVNADVVSSIRFIKTRGLHEDIQGGARRPTASRPVRPHPVKVRSAQPAHDRRAGWALPTGSLSAAEVMKRECSPLEWVDSMQIRVLAGTAIDRHVALGTSPTTQILNIVAGVIPERAWRMPAVLRLMGVAAKATLGTGRRGCNEGEEKAQERRSWQRSSCVAGSTFAPTSSRRDACCLHSQ